MGGSIFMKKINIGLIGFGTVGTGVAKILIENRDLITSRVGAELILKRIADIDVARDRGIRLENGVLIQDADKLVCDPDIDIVIELIGGDGIAKDLILKAIENKKHVVTANKALLAGKGDVIFKAAASKRVDIAFEASVGGCIPIIKTLRESLVGNHITSMIGILNGTCNYILSKYTDEGGSFDQVLKQAQSIGFAESDPTLDIGGFDAAHKIALISSLAYGTRINFDDIFIEGISGISPVDIECARLFGYKIKLLAISKHKGNAVEVRVHPTMIPFDNLLSSVNGSMNAISISGDAIGDMVLYGHGAGMMPTASAVVSDVTDIARNLMCSSSQRIPALSYQTDCMKQLPVLPVDDIQTYYYVRFSVKDRAGVLASISGVLGRCGISLKSVNQKGLRTNGSVIIVMLTHLAKESDIQKAVFEIGKLDVVNDRPVLIRIEDENRKDAHFGLS
jgi:homoserine dehydrogenase